MSVELAEPIHPGTRHVFLLDAGALLYEKAIDYACGPHILLHVSIRDGGRLIVLNNRMGGAWGQEQRLVRPAASSLLELTLLFGTGSVEVAAKGQPPLFFARGADLGEARRINLADVIRLTRIEPPLQTTAGARLMPSPPAPFPVVPSLPAGGIDHADVLHLSGWLAAGPLPADAALVAEIGGRDHGRLPLAPWTPGPPRHARFRIPFTPLAAEEQEVTLLLATGQGRVPLHRARLASAMLGGLDRATPRMLRGWAWNPRWPEAPVTVEILLNGEPVGQALANRERPDLQAIHPALKSCGFLFRLPGEEALARGQDHVASARVLGLPDLLPGSPWPLARRLDPAGALCRAAAP
jgi:hypothetical protein